MKQILFFICVIPSLLTAQNSIPRELRNEFMNGSSIIKSSKVENRIWFDCDSVVYMLDTIYTYKGPEKRLVYVDAITYDEMGRKELVMGRVNTNGNDIIDEHDGRYKEEYVYQETGDSIIRECIIYDYTEEEGWQIYEKEISIKNKSNIHIGYYSYIYNGNEWVLLSQQVATGFNERGLPVVVKNAYFYPSVPESSYQTLTKILYNTNDLDSVLTYFLLVEKGILKDTVPVEKAAYTYDANCKLSKYVHSYYDADKEVWDYGFTINYTYDEKGNPASEIETNEFGTEVEIYYRNIYSSTVSNVPVFSVQSAVYPNPVSDILNVTIDGVDEAVITLINANGSTILKQSVQQPHILIPVNSLAKGYYFLTVQTNKGTKTHKVLIK